MWSFRRSRGRSQQKENAIFPANLPRIFSPSRGFDFERRDAMILMRDA